MGVYIYSVFKFFIRWEVRHGRAIPPNHTLKSNFPAGARIFCTYPYIYIMSLHILHLGLYKILYVSEQLILVQVWFLGKTYHWVNFKPTTRTVMVSPPHCHLSAAGADRALRESFFAETAEVSTWRNDGNVGPSVDAWIFNPKCSMYGLFTNIR